MTVRSPQHHRPPHAATLRIPITNICDHNLYTALILVGSPPVAANVLLDTGSSSLAVDPKVYKPASDKDLQPTKFAQSVPYADRTGWMGPIVKTSLTLGNARHHITLRDTPVAITEFQTRGDFSGTADGIIGLAYLGLNDAYKFPQATFPWPFPGRSYRYALENLRHHIRSKKVKSVLIQPYFHDLAAHGLTMNRFALYTLRSCMHKATVNQSAIAADPLNKGVFVVGGGAQETDLYTGDFVSVEVSHDVYYNTHLLSVQVEGCDVVDALPLQSHFDRQDYSNSIIDSGTSSIDLAHDVFRAVIRSLEHLNPKFGSLIRLAISSGNHGIACSMLDLEEWPDIHFFFRGPAGRPAKLTCSPSTYWQVNSPEPQRAFFQIDQGSRADQAHQSVFGLPLLNNYYTVFDRSKGKNKGLISFARINPPPSV